MRSRPSALIISPAGRSCRPDFYRRSFAIAQAPAHANADIGRVTREPIPKLIMRVRSPSPAPSAPAWVRRDCLTRGRPRPRRSPGLRPCGAGRSQVGARTPARPRPSARSLPSGAHQRAHSIRSRHQEVGHASLRRRSLSGVRPDPPARNLSYIVMNSTSVIVWLPLASIARTSTLYWVPGSRNSAGTVTLVVLAGRSTLNTRRGFSRSTMT